MYKARVISLGSVFIYFSNNPEFSREVSFCNSVLNRCLFDLGFCGPVNTVRVCRADPLTYSHVERTNERTNGPKAIYPSTFVLLFFLSFVPSFL